MAWSDYISNDRYGLVLLLLLLDTFVIVMSPSTHLGLYFQVLAVAITLLLTLRTSHVRRTTFRIAFVTMVLSIVMVTGVLVSGAFGSELGILLTFILAITTLAAAIAVLRRVIEHQVVTIRTLFGAVSFYIMIAIFFAFLYLLINNLIGHPFFVQTSTRSMADYLYFSYIALTTTGFGDLTPTAGLPRAAVVLEVVLGQIFLVTTVARLVSLYGQQKTDGL